MALYTQNTADVMLWPEPMESSWQWLPSGPSTSLAKKMPRLSLADVLFIGAVTAIPSDRRPWGLPFQAIAPPWSSTLLIP